MSKCAAVILAAGKGTRMKSDLPKVLHPLLGKPMLQYPLSAALAAGGEDCLLVVGHQQEEVRAAFGAAQHYVVQEPQLGTGHALQIALPALAAEVTELLVLCGDTPLLRAETLAALRQRFLESGAACTVLTAELAEPRGYGRIIRDAAGEFLRIAEEKDASPAEKQLREVNSGVYCFQKAALAAVLADLQPANNQGEYYITDALAAIRAQGGLVNSLLCGDAGEIGGVNDRWQLAEAERALRLRKNRQLMLEGVSIVDPANTYIELDVQIGADSRIEPGVILRGQTVVGAHCHLEADTEIRACTIGDHCHIQRSLLVESTVGSHCEIGPFAYLRPGTVLADRVKAGHFVEIKKSQIGVGSKIPHLSYVGDSVVGQQVNVGCGTITCNYDGKHKHRTVIEDHAFIGSNVNLVAPVTVGAWATVAAGSTITKDVPPGALGVARGQQRNVEGWAAEKDPRRQD